jgi:hypothetical protein
MLGLWLAYQNGELGAAGGARTVVVGDVGQRAARDAADPEAVDPGGLLH